MTDTIANSPLTGNVLFYGQPEPLSPEAHGKLGVKPVDGPYGFVAKANIVPLTVTEFAPAALSYPVIFVGENKQPVAVMGLREGDNLFVTDGQFRADAYIPAYVRRYPFVFANDEAQKRLILCIDRSADFIGEDGDITPLFVDGAPSPYTQQAMEFCNNFEQERQRTDAFVTLLKDLDLFETRETTFTPRNPDGSAGQPQKIAEFFAVSEEKLKGLSAEKFIELRDNGALGQIYAHLASLMGWDRLIALAFQQGVPTPTPTPANVN